MKWGYKQVLNISHIELIDSNYVYLEYGTGGKYNIPVYVIHNICIIYMALYCDQVL